MSFFKTKLNTKPLEDQIFTLANEANQDKDPNLVNATIGSLCDEDHKLVSFESVYKPFKSLNNELLTKYAQGSKGNDNFLKTIEKHVIGDRIKLSYDIIATAGGTGAIYTALKTSLNPKERLYIPSIAWGNYRLMAEDLNLDLVTYDPYNLEDLELKLSKDKIKSTIIINSPCQNPCGLSYDNDTWQDFIYFLNQLEQKIIIINDIAYIDFSYQNDPFSYLTSFNQIGDHILVLIAYSLSKAFTAYGMRVGALISISKDNNLINELNNAYQRSLRASISNINNGFMETISRVDFNAYLKEKDRYIALLKKRSELFINECQSNNLAIYHYDEGFFVTLKIEHHLDEIHKLLLENHIYALKVNKGIRIALCSTSLKDLRGLASRIKKLIDTIIK